MKYFYDALLLEIHFFHPVFLKLASQTHLDDAIYTVDKYDDVNFMKPKRRHLARLMSLFKTQT